MSEMEVIKNQKAKQHGTGIRSSFQSGLLRIPPALFSFYTLLLWFSFSGMLFSLLCTPNLLIFQNQYKFSTIPFQNGLGWAYSFVVVIVCFFLMNYISYCICHFGVLNHTVVCFANQYWLSYRSYFPQIFGQLIEDRSRYSFYISCVSECKVSAQ